MDTKDLILEHTARAYGSGYGQGAGSYTRPSMRTFHASSSSPKSDVDPYNGTMRQRGRTLVMTSPVAAACIDTIVTNVVGTGLKLKSRIDTRTLGMTPEEAEKWQDKAELEFALFADKAQTCDSTGLNNFYALSRLVEKSCTESGDCFVIRDWEDSTPLAPYSLRLRVIEADRCATPYEYGGTSYYTEGYNPKTKNKIYDGVEVNSTGKVVAYWFRSNYPNDVRAEPTEWTRIETIGDNGVPNVLHITESARPEQYRGVTAFAPIMEETRELSKYMKAELGAAVLESYFTVIVKSNSDVRSNPFNPQYQEEPGDQPSEFRIGQNTWAHLKPGEDVVFADPTRPSSGLPEFEKVVNKHTAAALGLPSETVLKEHNKSYSASRASRLDAQATFQVKRSQLIENFAQPVYEMLITEAVARGRISAPGFFTDPIRHNAYLGTEWVGPTMGQLDPVKEVNAIGAAVDRGWTTNAAAAQQMFGTEFDSNAEELEREAERMKWKTPASESTQEDVHDWVIDPVDKDGEETE